VRISEVDAFRQSLADPTSGQQQQCAAAATASAGGAYMTDQEKCDAWWSAQDFSEVKEEVKRQCKDRRQDQHYSDCLTDAYQSACIVAASCGSSDDGWGTVLSESQVKQLGGSSSSPSSSSLPAFPDEVRAYLGWTCQ
jgi:hypothetical protein